MVRSLLDPLGGLHVDDRPDMQAADVGMAVAGAFTPCRPDDRRRTARRTPGALGPTAVSSTNATGLASPTIAISSEKPALRTFQKSSLAAFGQASCGCRGRRAGPRTGATRSSARAASSSWLSA